jgi:hypothetical protein
MNTYFLEIACWTLLLRELKNKIRELKMKLNFGQNENSLTTGCKATGDPVHYTKTRSRHVKPGKPKITKTTCAQVTFILF